MNVMIDIEGLGKNDDRGAILAIGACTFDGRAIYNKMYCAVDLLDSIFNGFTIDPDTVAWWRKQPDEAKVRIKKGIPVRDALNKLGNFILKGDIVWAKGPDYDLVMLNAAYGMLDMRTPFQFRNARCVRTILDLGKRLGLLNIEREGVKHFALDDAVYQAQQIMKVINHVQQLTRGLDKVAEHINLW